MKADAADTECDLARNVSPIGRTPIGPEWTRDGALGVSLSLASARKGLRAEFRV